MEKTLQVGKTYAVTSSVGCTVTDANGTVVTTAESGQQAVFVAPTTTVTFSDDSASVVAVFKLALAKSRLFEQLGGGRLPTGYLPALFLESTGTQYLNTGIKLSNESEVACGFKGYDYETYQYIYGRKSAYLVNDFSLFVNVDPSTQRRNIGYAVGNKGLTYPYESNVLYKTIISSEKAIINGQEILVGNEVIFETPSSCTLFGYNSAPYKSQIYNFAIALSKEKQCNYIPAIDSAGVPCMWDSVTMTPKYNAGTDDFIVGLTAVQARKLGKLPDGGGTLTISLPSEVVDENGVLQDPAIFTALSQAAAKGWSFILQTHDGTAVEIEVPLGYIQCDFLESTGTQSIDTGLLMSSTDDLKTTFAFLSKTDRYAYIYDSGTTWGVDRISGYIQSDNSGGNTLYALFGSVYAGLSKLDLTRIYTAESKDGYSILNGKQTTTQTAEFESSVSLRLFSRPNNSAPALGRIFDFLVSNSGTERLNLIPAITPAGVPCMWDSVTSQPFTNAGSGVFICGMTAAQAVQLANLPTGGGALTVSLPQSILNDAGEITDAAVRAALNKAADNGWTITLQYYTEQ